ncbi:MAG TPA: hypothetical protein VFK06_18805, partial [Candidatus Angelobacter sp.]|nr:hypothetical protein [Candidatus Angelobacter sp.]
ILRRKSSEYARAIVGLQENFQSTTILSHSTLIPAYIIIPIVTRNGLMLRGTLWGKQRVEPAIDRL